MLDVADVSGALVVVGCSSGCVGSGSPGSDPPGEGGDVGTVNGGAMPFGHPPPKGPVRDQ